MEFLFPRTKYLTKGIGVRGKSISGYIGALYLFTIPRYFRYLASKMLLEQHIKKNLEIEMVFRISDSRTPFEHLYRKVNTWNYFLFVSCFILAYR